MELLRKFCKLYLHRNGILDALREVKMPPKMKKKGRPRGTETTVIGLPQAKKRRVVISKPKPFSKSSLLEKDRIILECFANKIHVVAAIDGLRLLPIDDLFGFNATPDTARDENIDIHRVEKHFNQTDGIQHWKSSIKKKKVSGRNLLITSTPLKKKVVLSVKYA